MRRCDRTTAPLLAVLVIAGCRSDSRAFPTRADATIAASASTKLPPPPAWLAEARRLYETPRNAPVRHPFGRVRATLAITDGDPAAFECPEESPRRCTLEGRFYVRAERVDGGLSFKPQCSVLRHDDILGRADRHAPWQLVSGALSAGRTAGLRGRDGAALTLSVERWTDPAPLPPQARDAWVYARSLIVAHAKTYGIALDVDGPTRECPEDASPSERDACGATRGGPLAMLMDPEVPLAMNGEPERMKREPGFWVRERVLALVHRGAVGGFVGRASPDEPRVTCAQIEERMRPFAGVLLAHGLDVVRFTLGSVLTDGDLYYPQVSLRQLAHVLNCLGFAPVVTPALRELDAIPSLDWQNRFRAECVVRLLEGGACDLDLLRKALGPDAADGGDLDDLDRACADGLMGQWMTGG